MRPRCGPDRDRGELSSDRAPRFRRPPAGAGRQSKSSAARTNVCHGQIIHCARISPRSCEHYRRCSATDASQLAPACMTQILVTGGSGFIGQHLVSALVEQGRQVRVLDVRAPSSCLAQVEYVRGSVLDRSLVDDCVRGVDQVYHLAGLPGMWMRKKADFHAVNCSGTEIVISTARKHGIERFLHCSTESILFRCSPSNTLAEDTLLAADEMPGPYTRSKMLAEQLAVQAARSGFPVVIGT